MKKLERSHERRIKPGHSIGPGRCPFNSPNFNSPNSISPNSNSRVRVRDRVRVRVSVKVKVRVRVRVRRFGIRRIEIRRNEKESSGTIDCLGYQCDR